MVTELGSEGRSGACRPHQRSERPQDVRAVREPRASKAPLTRTENSKLLRAAGTHS